MPTMQYHMPSYLPYYLMFLRDPRLPANLPLGTEDTDQPEIDWLALIKST